MIWFWLAVSHLMTALASDLSDVILTSANIDKILNKDKFSMVLFYSPWQKDCKDKVRLIDELRERYKEFQHGYFFGKGDIYNDLKLGSQFRVEGYCELKYFVKGSNVPERYLGSVDVEDVVKFIEEKSDEEVSHDDFKQPLIKLDVDTFDRYVKDKDRTVLVLFHAMWSDKCKRLMEVMRTVARNFKNEPHCVFAHLDGEHNYDVIVKERVGQYPSIKFYPKNNKDGEAYLPGKYDERWSVKNITKFMSIYCKSKTADDHIIDKMYGRINDLDLLTRNFIFRAGNQNEQEKIVRDTVLKIQELAPDKRASANFYLDTMRQVLKVGIEFLDDEIEKLDKVLLGEMLENHRDEAKEKRNILNHFRSHRRDEL